MLFRSRDRAFAGLGDTNLTDGVVQGDAPAYHIDSVTDYTGNHTGAGTEDVRVVKGTVTVPCFLNQAGCPSGSTFDLDSDQMPIRSEGNTMQARFSCNIPRSVVGDGAGGWTCPRTGAAYVERDGALTEATS